MMIRDGCSWRRTLGRAAIQTALAVLLSPGAGAQIYVAPGGSDSWPGTIDSPFVSIPRAVTAVSAGGLIYLRGGNHVYASGVSLNKNGSSGQVIRLWAYPGETPVLDFSTQPRGTASRGVTMGNSWWHVRGLTVHSAGDNGIYITGSNNTVEACILYNNEDTGLQISGGGSNNLVLNCDSYANYDSATHGENADGFAPKLNIGPGNVFRGCRAWDNADDGWDIFEGQNTVLIDSCWAFRNGYNIWGDPSFQGDGNGFKLGGNFIAGAHLVTRSVAFDNRSKGFDQNNNTAGQTIHNCTGYRNLSRNYSFPAAPTTGTHVMRNNISYAATDIIVAGTVQTANSWQGFTVTAADFLSLDTALADAPRDLNGNLPAHGLFRLAAGSDLINGGVDVGLPYNGPAPDLGAFETPAVLPAQVVLLEPADGAAAVSLSPVLRWRTAAEADSYRLQLSEDSLWVSPVLEDTALADTFRTVSGLHADRTYYWRIAGDNGGGTGLWSTGRRFTTAALDTLQLAVSADWNLVSLPVEVPDPTPGTLFPSASSGTYAYAPDNGYVQADSLRAGIGYWVKFPGSGIVIMGGMLRTTDTVEVVAGWSMVGSLSVSLPAADVATMPEGILASPFYRFDGAYTAADTLLPGTGYWIKASQPGLLIFSTTPAEAGRRSP